MPQMRLEIKVLKPRKGDPPGPTVARIMLNSFSNDSNGEACLSCDCQGEKAVLDQVKVLRKDLDAIESKAKKIFQQG